MNPAFFSRLSVPCAADGDPTGSRSRRQWVAGENRPHPPATSPFSPCPPAPLCPPPGWRFFFLLAGVRTMNPRLTSLVMEAQPMQDIQDGPLTEAGQRPHSTARSRHQRRFSSSACSEDRHVIASAPEETWISSHEARRHGADREILDAITDGSFALKWNHYV